MGRNGNELVRGQFLIRRALRDELALYRLLRDPSIPVASHRGTGEPRTASDAQPLLRDRVPLTAADDGR